MRELDPITGIVPVLPEVGAARARATDAELEDAVAALLDTGETPPLAFQPIIDIQQQLTVGYEALTRFRGPCQATPDRWFMAAERMGRGAELEARVIEGALAVRPQLPRNCFLSINVAPEALLSPPVQGLLRGAPLQRVVFELTEHSQVTDYELLSRAVSEVRGLGAFVAVDDAGAGYASLQHILVLRPDFVKLDRALIAGLQLDEAKAALVEMFGGFTSRIDAWLLAEGIEEQAELARLVQLGVALGQGYLLGRPQAQMSSLDPALAQVMRALVPENPSHLTLRHLMELQTVARQGADDRELASVLGLKPSHSTLLLLDESSRPVAFAVRGADSIERHAALCVLDSTDLESALKRALTREPATRFHPLVCCDERGKYRGVVRIERVIEALLR
ncbi:MAG: putative diguanylate phosphodiesterase [Myxococcaceae bacterium]|nr:putative diguanylate phosphodiesterase [Myxococcaceae bacterium]